MDNPRIHAPQIMNKKDIEEEDDEINQRALIGQISELLFALLPFAVVFLVFAYQNKGWEAYLMAPEWAFAAALLFGQTIVKVVQGTLRSGRLIVVPVVGLTISMLIVLGLVPSMVLLALILTANSAPLWVGISQVVLAVLASCFFILLGTVSEALAIEGASGKR